MEPHNSFMELHNSIIELHKSVSFMELRNSNYEAPSIIMQTRDSIKTHDKSTRKQ